MQGRRILRETSLVISAHPNWATNQKNLTNAAQKYQELQILQFKPRIGPNAQLSDYPEGF